jgi:hypothetical protein
MEAGNTLSPVLPSRPFKLRRAFVVQRLAFAGLLATVGVIIAVGGTIWEGGSLARMARDSRTWKRGVSAKWAEISVGQTAKNQVLFTSTFHVSYRDRDDVEHEGEVEFTTFARNVPRDQPAQVRYDPNEKDRFALSWEIGSGWSRWVAPMVEIVLAVAVGLLLWWSRHLPLSRLRDARECGAASEELALPLVESEDVQYPRWPAPKTGDRRYRVRDGERVHDVWFGRGGPLFADGARRYVVALRSAPREVLVVVSADLRPFVFSPEEERAIRARIAANTAPSP